jgi:hypothetical protein
MARAELASGSPPGEEDEAPWQSPAPELDEDSQAARDEVRRAVEAARAELDASLARENTDAWYDPSFKADTGDADASGPNTAVDERDEVRRAVAAARAELDGVDFSLEDEIEAEIDWPRESGTAWPQASGPEPAPETTPVSEQAPAVTWQMPELQDLSLNPSVIMLEDVQGHVDLARVYEVLAHLDCTETASLLNYASHNVSIGLSSSNVMPSAEQITEAVKAVFGRGCKVTSDGIRLSVRIGDEHGRAA